MKLIKFLKKSLIQNVLRLGLRLFCLKKYSNIFALTTDY